MPPCRTPTRFIESNWGNRVSEVLTAIQIRDTYVVRSVRVVIYTAEKRGCRVATDVLDEKVTTTWVLIKEVGDVVDEASDDNQRAFHSLILDCA